METIGKRRLVGLFLGPLLFITLLLIPPPTGMPPEALRVAAVATLMAVWWVTEAIPIAATALLPIALFPTLGVMGGGEVTRHYAHHLIYLFLGGFLIAIAMERWQLHRRVALNIVARVGGSERLTVLGFMLATALLSMWISNTATAMMMLPIAMAVVKRHSGDTERPPFGGALMLGIAYGASIGGVATIIGTPPNAILVGMVSNLYGETISFAQWFAFGLPLSMVMLILAWLYLTRLAFPLPASGGGGREEAREELATLGPMTREERSVLAVFSLVALSWMGRGLLDLPALKGVTDSTIAMLGALSLFLIPSDGRRGVFLLDWANAKKLPWDILILFGGGFALAAGFSDSGLARWIVEGVRALEGVPLLWIMLAVTALVIFLTELTSNTATATLVVPPMGALAAALAFHPYALMIPAAIAASFAFMLPVATPPNAIVFSSRYFTIAEMARAGVWLNLIAVVVIVAAAWVLLPLVWGVALTTP